MRAWGQRDGAENRALGASRWGPRRPGSTHPSRFSISTLGRRTQLRSRCWRRLRDQRGSITLMESLVTVPAALLVLGAAFSLLVLSTRSQLRTEKRKVAVSGQKLSLERITRELRKAKADTVVSFNGGHVQATICSKLDCTATYDVTFQCSSTTPGAPGTCTRTVSGSTTTIARNVVNDDDVFHLYSRDATTGLLEPDPQFPSTITVRLKTAVESVRSSGHDTGDATHPVVYEDTFMLRNSAAGN